MPGTQLDARIVRNDGTVMTLNFQGWKHLTVYDGGAPMVAMAFFLTDNGCIPLN